MIVYECVSFCLSEFIWLRVSECMLVCECLCDFFGNMSDWVLCYVSVFISECLSLWICECECLSLWVYEFVSVWYVSVWLCESKSEIVFESVSV